MSSQLHDVDSRDSGQIHIRSTGTPGRVRFYQFIFRERFGYVFSSPYRMNGNKFVYPGQLADLFNPGVNLLLIGVRKIKAIFFQYGRQFRTHGDNNPLAGFLLGEVDYIYSPGYTADVLLADSRIIAVPLRRITSDKEHIPRNI